MMGILDKAKGIDDFIVKSIDDLRSRHIEPNSVIHVIGVGLYHVVRSTDPDDGEFTIKAANTDLRAKLISASVDAGVVVTRGLTTQAIPQHNGLEATETVIDFGTDEAGVIDIDAGVVTFTKTVSGISGNMELHVSRTGGGQASEFVHWVELSLDGGSTWIAQPNTLRRELIPSDGNRIINTDLSSDLPIPAGFKLRIVASNDSAFGTLSIQPPVTLTTSKGSIAGFASKLNLHYIL